MFLDNWYIYIVVVMVFILNKILFSSMKRLNNLWPLNSFYLITDYYILFIGKLFKYCLYSIYGKSSKFYMTSPSAKFRFW